MDFDEVADELYAVPPEEFVTVRKARQDQAKADGDKELAQQIGALPKPSSAAWAANLLVREKRAEIDGLVELGALLREAQETLAGDQLRTLSTQRGQLLAALARQATALAREHGHPISGSIADQVQETLRAAMTDPEAGEALLSGRLTSAMTYSGLGTTGARPDLRLVHPPRTGPAREAPSPKRAPARADAEERRRRREEEQRRAAEERLRRDVEEARRAADEATALAQEAQAAVEEERSAAEEARRRRDALQVRVDTLTEELAQAEEEASAAAGEFKRAERRRGMAERHADEARAAQERAETHLRSLEGRSHQG